jgi:dephospho-CoA kinase
MCKVLLDRNGQPIKIALIGGARTGKDTIAGHLCNIFDFKRVAFGDGLRDKLFETFPDLPHEPKPRQALIDFGQACRKIDPLVWIKQLHRTARVYEKNGYLNLVITDVRQPNEVEYCRKMGYKLVKVVSSADLQIARASQSGEKLDVNNELDAYALGFKDFNYIIYNNGSLETLYSQVENLISVENQLEG